MSFSRMIKWLAANNLVLNLDQTNIRNTSSHSTLCIGYTENYIEETVNTKFLGLQIDNHINWKNHIEQMIPKLSGACYEYAVQSMVHIGNIHTLRSIYYAYFHSIIKYGIKFWGNSSMGRFSPYKKKIQNYGWCTTQNLMQKSISTIRDSTCFMQVYTFINDPHYQKSGKFSNKFSYTQFYYKEYTSSSQTKCQPVLF